MEFTTSGVRWTGIRGCSVYWISTLLVGVLIMASRVEAAGERQQSVVEKTTVTILCFNDNRDAATNKFWSKDSMVLYNKEEKVGSGDLVDRSTLQASDYSLTIQSVEPSDAGNYRCQTASPETTEIATTTLVVYVAPGEPSISFSKIGNLQENDEVTIKCSSSGGIPAPTMTVYRDNVKLAGTGQIVGRVSEFNVVHTLTYEDNLVVFKCSVANLVNEDNPKTTTTTRPVLYAPRLSIVPYSPLVMLRGGSGSALCVADGNPPVEPQNFQWKKNSVVQSGSTDPANITFTDVKDVEKGTYVCSVSNSVATRDLELAVEVQFPPSVTIVRSQPTFRENLDEITLMCNFQANPAPASDQIVWYKAGSADVWPGSKLTFPKAERQHSGTYTCNVTNVLQISGQPTRTAVGSASSEIVVHYVPGEASVSGAVEVVKDERVQFTCSSADAGVPPAEYRWRKQGSPNIVATGPSYVVTKATLADDGVYQCIPHNAMGEGPIGAITLTILERPEWTTELQPEQTAKVTDTAFAMTCKVRGKPEPEVTWEKDGKALEDGLYEVEKSTSAAAPNSFVVTSRLVFKGAKRLEEGGRLDSVRVEDSGNYSCLARNTYGAITSTGRLVVKYRPVIYSSLNRVAVDLNDTATIDCYAHAFPKPNFRWFFADQQLTHDGKTFLISELADTGRGDYPYGSQLIVEDVKAQYLGTYRCESTNEVGTATQNILLSSKTSPASPTALRSGDVTWESVELRWVPGFDGGHPQTFYVTYNEQTLVVAGTLTRKTITDLHPNTTYSINMYAKNQLGQGPLSSTIDVRTKVLAFPVLKDVKFHVAKQTVTFVAPDSDEYCVRVDVSKDNGETWENFAPCADPKEGTIKLNSNQYNQVNLSLCLDARRAICAQSLVRASKVEQVEEIPTSTIIIVGCVCGAVILILTIIFIVLCIRRRRPEKEYPDRPHMRPNSLPTNARASGRKNGGLGLDNPGMDSMERADPIFLTNSSPYGNGQANDIPYEMNDMMYNRDEFNSIDKKNLKNLPNVHNSYGDSNGHKLDDSSGSHPESGYSTPDPTKPKKFFGGFSYIPGGNPPAVLRNEEYNQRNDPRFNQPQNFDPRSRTPEPHVTFSEGYYPQNQQFDPALFFTPRSQRRKSDKRKKDSDRQPKGIIRSDSVRKVNEEPRDLRRFPSRESLDDAEKESNENWTLRRSGLARENAQDHQYEELPYNTSARPQIRNARRSEEDEEGRRTDAPARSANTMAVATRDRGPNSWMTPGMSPEMMMTGGAGFAGYNPWINPMMNPMAMGMNPMNPMNPMNQMNPMNPMMGPMFPMSTYPSPYPNPWAQWYQGMGPERYPMRLQPPAVRERDSLSITEYDDIPASSPSEEDGAPRRRSSNKRAPPPPPKKPTRSGSDEREPMVNNNSDSDMLRELRARMGARSRAFDQWAPPTMMYPQQMMPMGAQMGPPMGNPMFGAPLRQGRPHDGMTFL